MLTSDQHWQTSHPNTHFLLLLHIFSSLPLDIVDPFKQLGDFLLSGGVIISHPEKQEKYFTNTLTVLTGGNDNIEMYSVAKQRHGSAGPLHGVKGKGVTLFTAVFKHSSSANIFFRSH